MKNMKMRIVVYNLQCTVVIACNDPITFKCNRLHYNYFAIFMITLRLHQFSNVIN
jgi:hypothetical protein